MWISKNCWWLVIVLLSGCAAHIRPVALQNSYENKNYWLKETLYGGIFYDDDRIRLISETPFEDLKHVRSVTGDYIVPPKADELIKVGTRVSIDRIEWPTQANLFKRPLLTPRYLPWVYLTVALDRGDVTINREKPYILLVPEVVQTEAEFQTWLFSILSEKDVNKQFLSLSPSEQSRLLRPKK